MADIATNECGHTPGPWDMRHDDKRITIGCGLVEGPNGYDVAEVYNDDCPRELAEANARLIAAAPDMLAALQALEREFFPSPHPDDYPEWNAARAAIAKASGK